MCIQVFIGKRGGILDHRGVGGEHKLMDQRSSGRMRSMMASYPSAHHLQISKLSGIKQRWPARPGPVFLGDFCHNYLSKIRASTGWPPQLASCEHQIHSSSESLHLLHSSTGEVALTSHVDLVCPPMLLVHWDNLGLQL